MRAIPDDPRPTRVRHELHSRSVTVAEVVDLSATMRRIRFDLGAGDAEIPWIPLAATDHVKLAFPDENGIIRVPFVLRGRPATAPGPAPILRDYTVRAAGHGSLTVDAVVHEHGPAGRWAAGARPGDRLGCLGPRGSSVFPVYRRYLLGGDDTALPAVSRFLEELPAGVEVKAILEVADAASEQPMPAREGLVLRWVHRESGDRLADVLLSRPIGPDTFVFVAGEATQLLGLRRQLLPARMNRRRLHLSGYWRAGTANLDHHQPLGPDA